MSVFTQRIEGDNVDVVHVDGIVAVSNPGLTDAELRATPVAISGTVTANLGTVDGLALDATLTNGTQVTSVSNFPAVQTISGSVTVLNASIPVTGTFWQAVQPVSGTVTLSNPGLTDAELRASPVPVSGTVAVSNFPATVAVTQSTSPWVVSGTVTANLGTVDGLALDDTLTNGTQVTSVSNFPAIQPVSGTVAVSNFPASVEVSNDVGNPLPVSGTVAISNFPADADALAQASATAGQLGALVMGAVTTLAPTYTTATTNPLSIDTNGNLRVTSASNKATVATITRVGTSATPVTVLAANAARKKFVIRTETGTHTYVAYGSAASSTNYTYDLGADSTLEETVWTGSVSVVRASGTGSIQVTDLV